jgi:hypothetical protein
MDLKRIQLHALWDPQAVSELGLGFMRISGVLSGFLCLGIVVVFLGTGYIGYTHRKLHVEAQDTALVTTSLYQNSILVGD